MTGHDPVAAADRLVVGAFQGDESLDLVLQFDLTQIPRIAGGDGFGFCGRRADVSAVEAVDFGVHGVAAAYLFDEQRFGLHLLPHDRVVGSFGDIGEDFDLAVLVALPDDSSLPLFEISGPPRYVDVVQGQGAPLEIRSGAHLFGRADDDRHVSAIAGGEQRLHLAGLAGLMDEADFLCRHSAVDQFILDRGVDGELVGVFRWCPPVAEHDLQRPALSERLAGLEIGVDTIGRLGVDAHDLVGDGGGPGVLWGLQVSQARVQRHVATVGGDLECVVPRRFAGVEVVHPPAQIGDEVLDFGVGLQGDHLPAAAAQFRQRGRHLVAGDHVGEHRRDGQQVRDVGVLADPGDRPQLGSGRVHFHGAVGRGERRAPVAQLRHPGGL